MLSLGLSGMLAVAQEEKQEKIDLKSMPVVTARVEPAYPAEAKKGGIEGMVILNALIDQEGKVAKVQVEKSDARVLNKAALDAIRQWTFTPAVSKDGKTVEVWVTIPVKFKLAEKEGKADKK